MRIHRLSQAAFSKILWPRTRIRLALAKLSCHPQPADHTANTSTALGRTGLRRRERRSCVTTRCWVHSCRPRLRLRSAAQLRGMMPNTRTCRGIGRVSPYGACPGQPSFDQTKPWGAGQQAPLTAEYRAIFEASLADQAKGGEGNYTGHARCIAAGMPHMMVAFRPLEFVVTPNTTYILIADVDHYRRIFTDGRDWPNEIEPSYQGYSIGRWIDEDGDGRYDVLEVETRGFKGPRSYDASGLPLHFDN